MVLKFLLATIIDLLFGKKPPKPSKNIGTVAGLEEYIESMEQRGCTGLESSSLRVPGTNGTQYHTLLPMTSSLRSLALGHSKVPK